MEPLALSSGAAGILSLGISVCQGLLDYYRSWKDAEDQVAHMYDSIEALTETFRLLESALGPKVFTPAGVQKVEKSIRSAESGLQSLRKKLDKIHLASSEPGWKAKGMAQIRRTLFPFKESTLAKLKELGIELRQDLSLALDVIQIECSAASLQKLDVVVHGLNKVSLDVDALRERATLISTNVHSLEASFQKTSESVSALVATHSNEYRRKVYDWLSPLTMEFQGKHLDTFNTPGRQDFAAQSLLETPEFRHWQSRPDETLWCPGIQGTGKTILASYIINHLQGLVDQKTTHLAYFYLNYRDAEKQSVQNLLTSLICQLALSEPTLSVELIASYEAHGFGATRPSYVECTHLLRSVISRCAKVFLVIDAFDEYPEERRGQLVTELRHLRPRVSMLITSRDLPNIEHQLSGAVRLSFTAMSKDISKYLTERISSWETLKPHTNRDPTLCHLISTTITARSEGMFLQARLHFDFLTTKTTLRKLKSALTALPEGLNDTYDEAIKRINTQHPDQAVLARKVLCWVFHAFRPLSMIEMQHALAVETGDPKLDKDNIPDEGLLLSVCNGLVTYEKESGRLSSVHYTFQQYLEQRADSLFPDAQIEIVRTCLTYLCFEELRQGPCYEDKDFMALLSYAIQNWDQHARQGAEEACKDLILSFFSKCTKLSDPAQLLWVRASNGALYPRRYPSKVPALWLASSYGLEYMVSYILTSKRHSVNRKTTWGDTALHIATECVYMGVVNLLLKSGADIAAIDSDGNTALHRATFFRSDIYYDESFNWTKPGARTPAMSLNVTRLLLDHGADVNAINHQEQTALHRSIMTRQWSLMKLLLARGAKVTLKDVTVVLRNSDEDIAQILTVHDLQKQVLCDIPDDGTRSAAFKGRFSWLELLLSRALEQPSPDSEGRSLLKISAFRGSLDFFEYLVKSGFDHGGLDKQKRTCLHSAAAGTRAGCTAVLEYLLERGLNPSQTDVDGWTPLLWAAKAGSISNIVKLLDTDTHSSYQDDRDWIPFAVALYHENTQAAEILKPPNKPLPEIFRTPQSSISLRHPYVMCDGCDLAIIGSRYKCSECDDFDYCFKCIFSAEVTHASHRFDFIYWHDWNEDVQKTDRQVVMEELNKRETYMMSMRA